MTSTQASETPDTPNEASPANFPATDPGQAPSTGEGTDITSQTANSLRIANNPAPAARTRNDNNPGETPIAAPTSDIAAATPTTATPVAVPTTSAPATTPQTTKPATATTKLTLAARISGVIGIALAFVIVLAWFPRGIWNSPIQGIDAPAHYYFIRELLEQGPAKALSLLPNGGYYPPLFHLLAAGTVKLTALFGVHLSVFTALDVVWLVSSGILWPAGMLLLCSYFLRSATPITRIFTNLMIPLLAVASASHPFHMLYSGPLIAFGLASTLLPFLLHRSLHLLDALVALIHAQRGHRAEHVRTLLLEALATAAIGILCVAAHPRVVFTYALLLLPFVLTRLPWKFILAVFVAMIAGAGAFLVFMISFYPSNRYADPGAWFHTFVPTKTVPEALWTAFSDHLSSLSNGVIGGNPVAGAFAFLALIAATIAALGFAGSRLRDGIALVMAYVFVIVVYVCSASLTGAIPNILAAPWYRSDARTVTMFPFVLLPLLAFGLSCVERAVTEAAVLPGPDGTKWNLRIGDVDASVNRHADGHTRNAIAFATAIVLAVSMTATMALAQTYNPIRSTMSEEITRNAGYNKSDPYEQLTADKVDVMRRMIEKTGTHAAIISDPMNGSMYASTMFDANMLYPVYNPQHTKNGAIFGAVEDAFASGDGQRVLDTVCPAGGSDGAYFLAMGPQAASLQMFTFKQQYDPFHDQRLIDQYVQTGTMTIVQDYSAYGEHAQGWALYRFACRR
ncbi:DUF6541 family protein [Bifidobacterium callimiconis]|uniref:Transmembrane protein alanine and leucine rich n=1 Tax=Bifidobacterium callimiconis TaxID=2306973 RepID=A0A430FDG3_9BIFI|nr:DUF6541 family protein [Bifidobacterium callimiconis]RSX50869.1 hypothetical protein D2E23_1160 [Bifidobacterium callimiconis]